MKHGCWYRRQLRVKECCKIELIVPQQIKDTQEDKFHIQWYHNSSPFGFLALSHCYKFGRQCLSEPLRNTCAKFQHLLLPNLNSLVDIHILASFFTCVYIYQCSGVFICFNWKGDEYIFPRCSVTFFSNLSALILQSPSTLCLVLSTLSLFLSSSVLSSNKS